VDETDRDLRRLVAAAAALERVSGLRVAIIGGVARGVWATPRATLDVDVVLDAPTVDEALHHAADAGLTTDPAEIDGLARSGMTRLRLPEHPKGSVRMDVLAADHPYYVRVVDRSRRVVVFGESVRVASPEDVILLKLLADRSQDRADVEAILDAQRGRLDLDLLERESAVIEVTLPSALRRGP
jgi:hypothetical protein